MLRAQQLPVQADPVAQDTTARPHVGSGLAAGNSLLWAAMTVTLAPGAKLATQEGTSLGVYMESAFSQDRVQRSQTQSQTCDSPSQHEGVYHRGRAGRSDQAGVMKHPSSPAPSLPHAHSLSHSLGHIPSV